MEEIYVLLQERIECIDEVKRKFAKLDNISNISISEVDLSLADTSDLSHQIYQAKRMEKFRVIKENELMEVIFSLKSFDLNQKLKFQSKSYEIMKQIRQDFIYEKYNLSGETKDIAKLYLNFFTSLRLDTKVNDLKKAYANNKFMGYPIISALIKWLVEIARKYFLNILEEKNKDLNLFLTKKKALLNSNQRITQSVNLSRPQSMAKPRIQSQSRTNTDQSKQKISPDNSKEELDNDKCCASIVNINLNDIPKSGSPKSLESKSVFLSFGKLLKGHPKEHSKIMRSQTNPREVSSSLDSASVQELTQFGANSVFLKEAKFSKRVSDFSKQGKNLVQIYLPVSNQANIYNDVIEDLDGGQANIIAPQLFNLYKNIKRNKDTHLVTIDLDKKKELINHVYKSLYSRNLDIDRGITNFQTKIYQICKIEFDLQTKQKKAESYCENYSINFMKRFPHIVCAIANSHALHTPSKHQKAKSNNEKNHLALSGTQPNQSQETIPNDNSPFNGVSPKNIKCISLKIKNKKDIDSLSLTLKGYGDPNIKGAHESQHQSHYLGINQDSIIENQGKEASDTEDTQNKKKGNLGFGYRSEHHFRIIKKRGSIFTDGKVIEDKSFKHQKSLKGDNTSNWGNSDDSPTKNETDHLSERNSLPPTITSRRDGFNRTYNEDFPIRQKTMKTLIVNQKKL